MAEIERSEFEEKIEELLEEAIEHLGGVEKVREQPVKAFKEALGYCLARLSKEEREELLKGIKIKEIRINSQKKEETEAKET